MCHLPGTRKWCHVTDDREFNLAILAIFAS